MTREGRGRSRPYVAPTMPHVFLLCQHPKLVATPPAGEKSLHEIKFDGFTRNGQDWTAKFPELAADLAELPDCILDGELCALWRTCGPTGSSLAVTCSRSCSAFRSARLREVGSLPSGGQAILTSACKMRLEDIVSKRVDAAYGAGRSDTWVKAKCRPSQEIVIGDRKQGPGRAFKGLLVGVYERGRLTYAGSIKNGFGADSSMDAPSRTHASPFAAGEPPRKTSEIHWMGPELVAAGEIAATG